MTAHTELSPVLGGERPERVGLPYKMLKKLYQPPHSFVDFLPWVEYLAEDGVFLLEDNAYRSDGRSLPPRSS